jgi:uncharacterized protein HemX
MTSWMIFLIVITAILGGFFLEYNKNQKKHAGKNRQHEKEIDELRKLVLQMKRRVENLEAIAAEEPQNFNEASQSFHKIEVDDEDEADENRNKVSDMAKRKMENS